MTVNGEAPCCIAQGVDRPGFFSVLQIPRGSRPTGDGGSAPKTAWMAKGHASSNRCAAGALLVHAAGGVLPSSCANTSSAA